MQRIVGYLLLLLLVLPFLTSGQSLPAIEEKTKNWKKETGYFDFYLDEQNGRLWLEIDRFDQEFLYLVSLSAGLGSNDIGLDRGLMDGGRVVRFQRQGRKVLLVQPNYSYRADTRDAAEKKAVEQSFAQSVLWGFTAEAESGQRVLVDATDFLMRDAMQVGVRLKKMQQGNFSLDRSRSAFFQERIRNFPYNTEWESTLTLVSSDGSAGNYVQSVTPSSDAITLRVHHSFVRLPEAGFKPRVFDPRSSFIPLSFFDYSTPVASPLEKHYAIRHRLQIGRAHV